MKKGCSRGEKDIFGFLAGDLRKAVAATEHLASCESCRQLLESHARTVDFAAMAREESAESDDAHCDAAALAKLTPARAHRDGHLRECESCRLEWLLAQAEYPSPAPVGLADRVVKAWRGLVDRLADAMTVRVLVPVAAVGAIAVIAVLVWPAPFPYDTDTTSSGKILEIAQHRYRPADGGIGFTGISRPVAYQYGFVSGAARDLIAQGDEDKATEVVTDVLRRGGTYEQRVKQLLDDIKTRREPCKFLEGQKNECRIGVFAYGVVRDHEIGVSSPVPSALPAEIYRLATTFLGRDVPSKMEIMDRGKLVQVARALYGL